MTVTAGTLGPMHKRVAVVMAGGSGERFWPVSTRLRPKQFLRLTSPDKSLLEESVERGAALASGGVYVATGTHLTELTLKTCSNLQPDSVLSEPAKRNTAGCLVWVAANLLARDPAARESLAIGVLTADHRIHPLDGFLRTAGHAMRIAEQTGGLVVLGIRPTRPETGYGYIEVGDARQGGYQALRFREKPDLDTAKAFLQEGRFLWNSGMFFWTLNGFLLELRSAAPDLADAVDSIAESLSQGDTSRAESEFLGIRSVSIDYALMERSKQVYVVEAEFEWDDLGSWDAMSRSYEPDEDGNVAFGSSRLLHTRDSVVYNESRHQQVCVLGLEGVVVVATDDSVLVVPKSRAQEVKRFVQE